MKLLVRFFLVIIAITISFSSCSSCGNKNGNGDSKTDTLKTFNKEDTTIVLSMTAEFLQRLKDKNYDAACDMLNKIDNDSVMPLPDKDRETVVNQQKTFPVLDYTLYSFRFLDEHKVEITYTIKFFEKNPDDPIQNTINMTFAPQRINKQWYLALMNKSYMK